MQAITISQYGDPARLKLSNLPTPTPKDNEILIENHGSSVNPIDWKIRNGSLRLISGIIRPPSMLGSDFAGVIIKVGKNVKRYKTGDRIYGFVNPLKGGAYAEKLCVTADQCALIPESLPTTEAATIPLAALTAYQALCHIAQLKPGQWIAINGCSGGVGVMATQIATALGANVIGICSAKNHKLARTLGAIETIDYTQQTTLSSSNLCDVFFDVVGNQCHNPLHHIIKPNNSKYITTLPNLKTSLLSCFTKRQHVMAKPNSKDLQAINQMVNNKQIKTIIDQSYDLIDIAKAHAKSETGRVVGKLNIKISNKRT